MELKFLEEASNDLLKFDDKLKDFFFNQIEKLFYKDYEPKPFGKHLKHGLPFFVKKVTSQSRLIYCYKEDSMIIVRCFSSHKDYEKWYKAVK